MTIGDRAMGGRVQVLATKSKNNSSVKHVIERCIICSLAPLRRHQATSKDLSRLELVTVKPVLNQSFGRIVLKMVTPLNLEIVTFCREITIFMRNPATDQNTTEIY